MNGSMYKFRVGLLLLFFGLLYGAVIVRLYIVQICNKAFYSDLAQQQYFTKVILPPARGAIFDRSGQKALAVNHEATSAFILPAEMKEKQRTIEFLNHTYRQVADRLKKMPKSKFLWVDRFLSDERLAFLQSLLIPDLYFIAEPNRYYPFSGASQVIGFTDLDNKGISGFELLRNDSLKGLPTSYFLQRDARRAGFYFKRELAQDGKLAEPLSLTIDADLQVLAYEEVKNTVTKLEAAGGSAIVMNPDSGEVLAMVNYPDFDPNERPVKSLINTKNEIVTECYELGSVMKTFAALACLSEKAITLDEEIDCQGQFAYINGFKLVNSPHILYKVPFAEAVQKSSNVGIAKACLRIGDKLYDHYRKLGFGSPTGIDFPGERSGFVNPPKKWTRSSQLVLAFGYEMNATLLQIATAFCTLANGGFAVHPQLSFPLKYNERHGTRLYEEAAVNDIKSILGEIGKQYKIPGYTAYGKTGTARALVNKHYSTQEHHYTFGGFIEKDGYRRVIVTFVKRPRKANLWASQVTAQFFCSIAEQLVLHDAMKS